MDRCRWQISSQTDPLTLGHLPRRFPEIPPLAREVGLEHRLHRRFLAASECWSWLESQRNSHCGRLQRDRVAVSRTTCLVRERRRWGGDSESAAFLAPNTLPALAFPTDLAK